jgi:hypothetical protein
LEKSPNSKTSIKHLRRGLSIYKTGRSPFWHVRIYDALNKKYVVRSTKERHRLDATDVAEEILEAHKAKQNASHAMTKDRSFEHYAHTYSRMKAAQSKGSRNKRTYSDERKLLYREDDGVVSYFGKYDVGKITPGSVRDYFTYLDKRREQPLAPSTKTKHAMMIRKVLMQALEDGEIDSIPAMPRQRAVDKPRVSFTDSEYKRLIKTARKLASERATRVRGVLLTHEHVHMWQFLVHAFLRPTETELFALRFCDVAVKSDPRHLELTLTGKTGYRVSATMPFAILLYQTIKNNRQGADPTEYLFMPDVRRHIKLDFRAV